MHYSHCRAVAKLVHVEEALLGPGDDKCRTPRKAPSDCSRTHGNFLYRRDLGVGKWRNRLPQLASRADRSETRMNHQGLVGGADAETRSRRKRGGSS